MRKSIWPLVLSYLLVWWVGFTLRADAWFWAALVLLWTFCSWRFFRARSARLLTEREAVWAEDGKRNRAEVMAAQANALHWGQEHARLVMENNDLRTQLNK